MFFLPIALNQYPVYLKYDHTIQSNQQITTPPLNVTLQSVHMDEAEGTTDEKLPIIPYPKSAAFLSDKQLEITGKWAFPAGRFFHFDDFISTLKQRFEMPIPNKDSQAVQIDGGAAELNTPHQSFQITITANHISVLGRDEAGFRYGLRRLALLVYSKDGHIYLPVGTMTDWPVVKWRGFHLFSGPNAIPFQTRLVDRVLAPLGFTHAVIQCGRTAWDATPNVRGGITTSKADLLKLFNFYRGEGIDPIPLIESFGHMEWLFANNANLDIAENPKVPYAVDPRNPRTAVLLNGLWDEVIKLLHPDSIHFGCDEVALQGFDEDGTLVTNLWKLQMGILGGIAKKNQVPMMIWGDEALAKSEAIDAANAPSVAVAKERRQAIPAGTVITDWHYKDDANLRDYFGSLDTWKNAGFTPIATTWYAPNNIIGFTAAANQDGVGTLQSTWSGYESNFENPLDNYDQFAAFVLSAEYAWSGRQDMLSDLGYDYKKVFWQLYFERPILLVPAPGYGFTDGIQGSTFKVGRFSFEPMQPVQLLSTKSPTRTGNPSEVDLHLTGSGATLVLDCNALASTDDGKPIATVTITTSSGATIQKTLRYGWNVRAKDDSKIVYFAERSTSCATYLSLGKGVKISEISIEETDPTVGLEIDGITLTNTNVPNPR